MSGFSCQVAAGHGFDQYAENYQQVLGDALSVTGENADYFASRRISWFAAQLHRRGRAPQAVLDYGCGVGNSAPILLHFTGASSLLGVDISRQEIEQARRFYGSGHAKFISLDEFLPAGQTDAAYCNGVFHHIPPEKRLEAASTVWHALHPGGLFGFWENNPLNPGTRYVMSKCAFDEDAIPLTHWEAKRLVKRAGFEILATDFLFFFPSSLAPLRFLEPVLSKLPLGGQYQILCRRPE
ncbi:MAG TPA: class I SAM-dependent methyltransferase [Terriglobales bacterium]|nr:class I SAM-dependent methyltransferase [Terriglobales bacterium]